MASARIASLNRDLAAEPPAGSWGIASGGDQGIQRDFPLN